MAKLLTLQPAYIYIYIYMCVCVCVYSLFWGPIVHRGFGCFSDTHRLEGFELFLWCQKTKGGKRRKQEKTDQCKKKEETDQRKKTQREGSRPVECQENQKAQERHKTYLLLPLTVVMVVVVQGPCCLLHSFHLEPRMAVQ